MKCYMKPEMEVVALRTEESFAVTAGSGCYQSGGCHIPGPTGGTIEVTDIWFNNNTELN